MAKKKKRRKKSSPEDSSLFRDMKKHKNAIAAGVLGWLIPSPLK